MSRLTTVETLASAISADLLSQPAAQTDVEEVVKRHAIPQRPQDTVDAAVSVDSVAVAGVRSFAETQTISFSRGLTVVYAENGSGKTSFVDALELLTLGTTSRAALHPQIATELRDIDHIPHADTAGVAVGPRPRVDATWWSATVRNEEVRHDSVWAEDWGKPADDAPPMHLIARRRLREVLSASGTDRADRLAHSLGLESLSATWLDAAKSLKAIADDLQKRARPTNLPEEDLEYATSLATSHESAADLAASIESETQADAGTARGARPQSRAARLISETHVDPPTVNYAEALEAAAEVLEKALTNVKGADVAAGGDPERAAFLESFKERAVAGDVCPACEDGTVTTERLDEISRETAEISSAVNAQRTLQAARRTAQDLLGRVGATSLLWRTRLDGLPHGGAPASAAEHGVVTARNELSRLQADWKDRVSDLRGRLDTATRSPESVRALMDVAESVSELEATRDRAITVRRRLQGLQQALAADVQTRTASPAQLVSLRRLATAPQLSTAAFEINAARERAEILESACRALRRRVTDVINEQVGALATPINDWLVALAPDGTPPIQVRARGTSGRPALDVVVAGGAVKAVGRLSDSQLDMLGLATHLASLERDAPGQPVVIDDPTDMLDRATMVKFAGPAVTRLLSGGTPAVARQVVVLTHDDDFVKALWTHHSYSSPTMMQVVIELEQQDAAPPRSIFSPRSASALTARVKTLLADHRNAGNRLWLRGAAGNQLRQAVELLSKDLLTVLGPLGIESFHAPDEPLDPLAGAGAVFEQLGPALDRICAAQTSCGAPRHFQAQKDIARLVDCLSRRKELRLDEASHADVVYPSVAELRELAEDLEYLCGLLEPARGHRADTWPSTSMWARHCTACPGCASNAGSAA